MGQSTDGSNRDLTGADRRGRDLAGSSRQADLLCADLRDAQLPGAVRFGGFLGEADRRGAVLPGAFPAGASLFKANLSGANLTGAKFWGAAPALANLTNANLTDSALVRVDLSGARMEGVKPEGADLRGSRRWFPIMAGILQREEGRLRAELTDIRARFKPAGNRGAMAEREFREFLRRCRPGDTRVGHGEVFDIDGRIARQTDVAVANQCHVALQADGEQPQLHKGRWCADASVGMDVRSPAHDDPFRASSVPVPAAIERRPPRPAAAAADGTAESEGA